MNPTAIFSKTGKGVQEASGKTSHLSRADRAVLKEIDGKTALANIAAKFEKISADKFDALIAQFDKDGYIREVSSGATAPQTPPPRTAPPPKAPPPSAAGDDDEMDFTQAIKLPPKAAPAAPKPPTVDLAAASRADAERKAKEQQGFDYKARQEAEAKAKAESEARARAEAQAQARAEAEAKARAEVEARARAESDAKVKAARDAALRLATEAKAKAEAEAKAKAKLEAELTGKLEEERRAREDAERRAAEAAEVARREMEEKAKRDADELRQRLEAEMKAKLEEERKAREAEDRKRREEEDRRRAEEDRKRREEDERRRKEEEARRAKEAAERKAREEEDRRRREEDERRRKEEEARRAKEAEERRAREEADRKRREEEDRKRAEEEKRRKDEEARRAKEEAERRAKEDADRRAREDSDRRAREDADRRAKEEAEEKARAARAAASQSSSTPAIAPVAPPPPPAAAGGLDDSLLADLDSFGKREEEEQKAKEEAERQAKEEAARKAKAEAERRAKEEADRKRREEEEQRRKETAERKAQEEAEQRAREEEERKKEEEDERKRKAKEALAAKEAERKAAQRAAAAPKPARPAAAAGDDDIGVTDDDLDMDDVKKDEKALSETARKAQREREQAAAIAAAPAPRARKWGKPVAIAVFVLLIGGIGVLQFMPVSTAEYEKAASEAMGVPVKIRSARLSVITGIEATFDSVSIGDSVKIKTVRGFPEVGTLFGGRKSFSRIELEGVSLSQSQLADAVLGKVAGENFHVGRILVKQAKLEGPLALPALDVEALLSSDGSLKSVSLRGGDKLVVQLSPKGSDIGFEISAGSLALPVAPGLTLSDFGMKGTANSAGVSASEFDGRAFDGVISGTAKVRWGANFSLEGEVRARGVRVAVLAPALVSEGKVDGRGNYTMSGSDPAKLFDGGRIQGEFKIEKGVLGSFDLTRALQTGGAQSSGRTVFSELTGQAVYDRGAIKISNVAVTAGAMNAGATLDIDANGGLSGRIVADVKTPNQTLRATLNLSGKIQDPVIRK